MLAIELYDWLKAFHVLAAVVWVGGNLTLQILSTRIVRENDAAKAADFAGHIEWVGTRIFTAASLLLVILGVWMVIDAPAWTFGQFWILAALVMFGYSFLSGLLYLGPKSAQLKKMLSTEGPSERTSALMRRMFIVGRIELVLLILIVFDMVLKPGL
jgi:uncharacterized membrane protein